MMVMPDLFYFASRGPALSKDVDDPVVPAFVFFGAGVDGVCTGGCSDVPYLLPSGVAGVACVPLSDAVTVRRA